MYINRFLDVVMHIFCNYNTCYYSYQCSYIKENLYFYGTALITIVTSVIVTKNIFIENTFFKLIANGVVSVFIYIVFQYVIFHKKEEYKYAKNLILSFLKNKKGK